MKRSFSVLIICLVCIFSFAGCGKNKDVVAAEEAIEAIGEVTLDSEDLIEAAEKLYDILTDKEKSDVSNRLDLAEAREVYNQLLSEQASKDYYNNLEAATYAMLLSAADTETAGNLIIKVWHNSIFEEKDEETDTYTRPNGTFYDDFNDALAELFSNEDFQDQISSIQNNQDNITNLMKDLRNPPADFEDAYNAIKEYYDIYLKFTNIVISPTGSYNSVSEDFNNLDNELLDAFNAMKLYIKD